jgi:hypothetical protein
MRVQVAYALATEQVVIEVELVAGVTVGDAIRASGILTHFPELDLATVAIGIFGERVALTDAVQDGDRVEIYRHLQADPKEARRRRARRRRR